MNSFMNSETDVKRYNEKGLHPQDLLLPGAVILASWMWTWQGG